MTWLQYSAAPLPTHLTQLPGAGGVRDSASPLAAAAAAVSQTILAFTGELAVAHDPAERHALALQLVQVGLAQPALRDEIIVQLLRHLRGNPSLRSRARGSVLLLCCFSAFAPSEALENHAEASLRFEWSATAAADASASSAVSSLADTAPVPADSLLFVMHRTAHWTARESPADAASESFSSDALEAVGNALRAYRA